MMNKFNPDYAIHVGQFLKNALNAYDMKNKEQHIITFTDDKNTKNYEEFMDSIEKIVISK